MIVLTREQAAEEMLRRGNPDEYFVGDCTCIAEIPDEQKDLPSFCWDMRLTGYTTCVEHCFEEEEGFGLPLIIGRIKFSTVVRNGVLEPRM